MTPAFKKALVVVAPLMSSCFTASAGSAQPANAKGTPRHWEFVAGVNNPLLNLEEQLRAALELVGWDHTMAEACGLFGCAGPTSYPRTLPGTQPSSYSLSISRRLGPHFGIAALMSRTAQLATGTGYRTPNAGTDQYVVAISPSLATNAMLFTMSKPPIRLGVGPASYRVKIDVFNLGGADPPPPHYDQFGGIAEIRLALNANPNSRFFADLRLQRRWMPKVTVGPFDVDSHATGAPQRVDAFMLSFNHNVLAYGVGFRW